MSQEGNRDEAKLVAAARAGDRGAFDQIVAMHAPRLIRLASGMLADLPDAEDAVQDALAAAWLALHRFDPAKPLGPWLSTITINKCRDAMRRRTLRRFFRLGAADRLESLADPEPASDRQFASRQMMEMVQREISRLPQRLKEPFVLVTFDGRSQAEAAAILGVSEKAVEMRIYRARNRLREKFTDF
ncbi:RNA polymerase sigma factor [Novosphingobium album (ex Hu et al. 2023)]|uniref:Sigma-70 family RNA polymerase sigma factor n=1 Tax=Novosphingobium album (ex Hu et al. 2023) TaxID=2930093 RepID=A0ABT0B001_9SPHN|nr:sigma-70 family RNA polymerase sigma factor [Novosphingobium album (ex Hu et al. 2023)]MCJ2178406.1 sigma-70 family RNA polymerase sigma factor [Novosphingobium album (ex Hu et al. 2023)]